MDQNQTPDDNNQDIEKSKKLLSILDIDFESSKKQMDSPRSLEACRQLGILPEELYFQDFETYTRMNPEVIGLPKEIQKIRFDNIDKYRKDTIEMVKEQRNRIIESKNENPENNNNNENNNNDNSNNNNENQEEKQIMNLDDQLDSMKNKEKKNIEKLKRRQKNEIEAEIETKIKSEMIRYKSELKDQKVREMNDKIREEMEKKARLEELKRKEKEKKREEE